MPFDHDRRRAAARTVIGIDVGGTAMKGGLVGPDGAIERRGGAPTPVREGEGAILDALERLARALRRGRRVAAVGLGVAGAVRADAGVVASSPNIPCWRDHPVGPLLSSRLGVPVAVENDANAAALAEARLGAGRGAANVLTATLGTGIGGGIVVGGRLWRGDAGRAGELGHTVVDVDGPRCACGGRGCVEAYASATGIRRLWTAMGGRARRATAPAVEDLAARARRGDARALGAFAAAGQAFGAAIATWINVLDIRTIVVGGGVAGALDLLLPAARAELDGRLFGMDPASVRIVRGALGDDAGVLGAALIARERRDADG